MGNLLQIWRVAELLDCSKRFVYSLIEIGELKGIRLGARGLRVEKLSVQKYIEKNEIKTDE